jgi:LysR family hydrogen peroxide-inducible transcriptional activator
MKPLPTLRQLSYLVALAEHRHFGRAADACFVTQSTLSAGLQEMEALLGVTLVERTKRRVMLTPVGAEVAARARRLLSDAEELADAARAAGEPLSGPLRLGVIPTIAPYLLPRVLPGLRERFPRLKLHLREDHTARCLEQLNGGELDAVLLALPYPAEELETATIGLDPFLLACPADHPLARLERVSSADLAHAELLLLEEGHCLREHALAACQLPSVRGRGTQATSLHTLVQMVANGMGVTLLPRMAVEAEVTRGTGLVLRPLADAAAAARAIGLAWRRSSPRRAEFMLLAEDLRGRMQALGHDAAAAF